MSNAMPYCSNCEAGEPCTLNGEPRVRCHDADIDALASARRDRGEELSPSLRVARVWCITLPDEVCERYVMSQQTSYELLTR